MYKSVIRRLKLQTTISNLSSPFDIMSHGQAVIFEKKFLLFHAIVCHFLMNDTRGV